MISLPQRSWAVTILRTEGSVVWGCGMVFLDKRDVWSNGIEERKIGETTNSLIYCPSVVGLEIVPRGRRTRTDE